MKDEAERNSLLRSLGVDKEKLVLARQVHGCNVKIVTSKDGGSFIEDCDGIITSDKAISLGIFTADCVPVIFVSKDKTVKAAVHAGWRGLAAGILQNAIKLFKENFSVKPENISAYIGPHIRECCYDVSADLENVFNVKLNNGKLNLSEIAADILKKEGIKEIFISDRCSCCESGSFFSYRKDKTEKRMITILL